MKDLGVKLGKKVILFYRQQKILKNNKQTITSQSQFLK
jgi:hypothetical protein